MFLADHGADVVKVEAAQGDPYRSEPGFQTVNRNKRSVRAPGPVALAALLDSADVIVVEEPGRAAELRVSYPGTIVVTLPPWGEHGPRVEEPATPDLVAAASGVFWNQQSYTEAPVALVLPVVAYGTAALGALAIAAALFARERDGAAPTYEVSWVAGAAAIQLADTHVVGPPEERPGSAPMGSKGRVPCYRLFQAGDSKWFFLACGTARFFERLLHAIGRADLVGDSRLPAPPWGLMDLDAIAFLAPLLEDAFRTASREKWLAILGEADIPAQPVWSREEFLASPLAAANELVTTVEQPDLGPVRMIGVPLVVESCPGVIRRSAPRLGEHDDVIEAHLPRRGHGQGGPPLAGIRTIDLASFIAGPVVSRHLAMLGAEVVKVEAPTGDPFRAFGAPFSVWNHGKRSIAVDLTTEPGRATLRRLAARSDVVVENFRPGVAERLGADATTLQAVNDQLVCLASTGYGADQSMASAPAFDPLLQALGGIMASQGGMVGPDDDAEPVFLTVAIHDVVTPLISAFGVVAALYHRLATGAGQRVRTSLAQTSVAVQAAEITSYAGSPAPAVGGWDYPGAGGSHGCYEDADGQFHFRDGANSVPIARFGLVNERIALDNGLCVTHDHPEWGPVTQSGQLIVGAGPAPFRGPLLDEHGDEIRAELNA